MIPYGFKKEVNLPFREAVEKVTESLKHEGFGVLTTIDMKAKFKEKLDVDFDNYVILGACNPPHAYEAVLAEPDIGLMLPCNVIVYEREGKTFLAVVKPSVAMQAVANDRLAGVATAVEVKLERAFDAV